MCKYCDGESNENRIWLDAISGDYYLELETSNWDNYEDGFEVIKEFINYCPYCGQRLADFNQHSRTI